jgi:hypothetical protein
MLWLAAAYSRAHGQACLLVAQGTRKMVPEMRRPAFDSLLMLTAWSLWQQRNDRVFRSDSKLPSILISSIWPSVEQWSQAKLLERSRLFGE